MALPRQLDIQTKINLVLISVIVPTFVIITIVQNKLTKPILEQELRHAGITTGEALAAEIVSQHLLTARDSRAAIEREMLQRLYEHPSLSIIQIDVFARDSQQPNRLRLVASSVEEDTSVPTPTLPVVEELESDLRTSENGNSFWNIEVPIRQGGHPTHAPLKVLGMVRVQISTNMVTRVLGTLWKITGIAAGVSVVILIFSLNYFLRKTIANERLLRRAETQNIQLSQQLQEAQRQMMNTEKFAVMGQLTANFAHEIGTPLNAIGGHLQLLREEFEIPTATGPRPFERLEIISGELQRIENIVKSFLQTTAKPTTQRQLVDVNSVIDKTMGILAPRCEGLDLGRDLDRKMGPLRLVPTDLEQILLNLANNALDSLKAKREAHSQSKLQLKITSQVARSEGEDWAEIILYDTGLGIKKANLKNVLKPFFTTKRPGEGTGLGLAICQQLASKYGGMLELSSKEGAWAQVKLKIPYRANA
jgi:signal transduction histidine kinase